jgi:hypothetical protein
MTSNYLPTLPNPQVIRKQATPLSPNGSGQKKRRNKDFRLSGVGIHTFLSNNTGN